MDDAHKAASFVLRHEYGRLVAVLLREFGAHRLAFVEDALSQALVEATVGWRTRGIPPNARAWIHRAARHRIIDEIRKERRHEPLDGVAEPETEDEPRATLGDDLHDDELRALFACAATSIPVASQIVFALRTLCGFSTSEIATRLVTSEENVQKRWERARDGMRLVNHVGSRHPRGGSRCARRAEVARPSTGRVMGGYVVRGLFAGGGFGLLTLHPF
jgi:RNA polymerase sigma-70 factor (ECF subfamily)